MKVWRKFKNTTGKRRIDLSLWENGSGEDVVAAAESVDAIDIDLERDLKV